MLAALKPASTANAQHKKPLSAAHIAQRTMQAQNSGAAQLEVRYRLPHVWRYGTVYVTATASWLRTATRGTLFPLPVCEAVVDAVPTTHPSLQSHFSSSILARVTHA